MIRKPLRGDHDEERGRLVLKTKPRVSVFDMSAAMSEPPTSGGEASNIALSVSPYAGGGA